MLDRELLGLKLETYWVWSRFMYPNMCPSKRNQWNFNTYQKVWCGGYALIPFLSGIQRGECLVARRSDKSACSGQIWSRANYYFLVVHKMFQHGKILFFLFSCAYNLWSKSKTSKSSWISYWLHHLFLISTCFISLG